MNDSMSLSSTRTCLFTAANDRSHKCSTGTYRETPIVPTSCTKHTQWGKSRGHRENGTKRTHTVHWAQTHLFTPYRKRMEETERKGGRESGRGEESRGEGGGGGEELGIYTHIQIQKNMYKSYSLQALCSHIYSHRNRQRNHSMAGPSIWDMQVQGLAVRKQSWCYEVWDKKQWSLRGRVQWRGGGSGRGSSQTHAWSAAAWGINHCRELHNQVLPIRAHSETQRESSRQLTPHSKWNTCTLKPLGHSYLARGHHYLYHLQSCVMHHGAEKCTY